MAEGQFLEQSYTYDVKGCLVRKNDGEGNETHYLYDGMGRKIAMYAPGQWKKRDGKRTDYQYDFLERLIDTAYPDGSHERLYRDGEGTCYDYVYLYAYCGNNPVMYYDPSGHLSEVLGQCTIGDQVELDKGQVAGDDSKEAVLLLEAEQARDNLITDTPGGNRKSMAIGAYDIKTGDVVADFAGPIPEEISPVLVERADSIGGIGSTGLTDKNTVGVCAEFRTANQLLLNGSDISNIRFTDPIRLRTGKIMPNCSNCLEMFSDILSNM